MATWIKCGDQNSIFFHCFESFSRNKKNIWEIKHDLGFIQKGQQALKIAATNHYKSFYGENEHINLHDSVKVAKIFPRPVIVQETNLLDIPCTLHEVWDVLNSLKKYKSPSPDVWTVQLFLHFFELVGDELL